ncbi:MAG: hypothetical protein ACYCPO_14270 [Acidobacteriaceae bacterium]
MVSGHAEEKPAGYSIPFLILLALYCAWIFTLPLFPSLDGSLHLYYASVLGSLLSGSKDFASYYFIRHVLPPYALHYYFLIAAAHFFGYLMADKLLVCLIFISTAFGFRYLARYLGPSGDVMSLCIIPLLLNWPLGMGFYNYCLAIGMALWALGFWYRAVQKRSHRLWLAFLSTVILMVLTHPVPLLLIYVLVGVDVGWRFCQDMSRRGAWAASFKPVLRNFRSDVIYMLLSWTTIGYIFPFVDKQKAMTNVLGTYDRRAELIKLFKLSTIAMFSGSSPVVIAYRLSLYAILLFSLYLGCAAAKRQWATRTYSPATAFLVCTVILTIAVPILPPVINGANYFSQRLVVFVWIGALAAASGFRGFDRAKETILATGVVFYSVAVLVLANSMIRPVAAQISEIETAPIRNTGLTGLTLSLPDAPVTTELNYVPYYWVGARYFRRSHSTLLNGGFLYEPYLPLGSHIDQLSHRLDAAIQNSPGDAYQLLLQSASARHQIMPHANLLIFTGSAESDELLKIVKELDSSEPMRVWVCNSHAWYSACKSPLTARLPGE